MLCLWWLLALAVPASLDAAELQLPRIRISLCVPAITHNWELASNPMNYMHWLFAHSYPLVTSLLRVSSDLSSRYDVTVNLGVALEGNEELVTTWRRQHEELLAPWTVQFLVTSFAVALDFGNGTKGMDYVPYHNEAAVERLCASHSAIEPESCDILRAEGRRALDHAPVLPECHVTAAAPAVPHLVFCDSEGDYWRDAREFAAFVRSRPQFRQPPPEAPPPQPLSSPPPRVFILVRAAEAGRRWDVGGLAEACETGAAHQLGAAAGVEVACGAWSHDTPLAEVARELGAADALIGAHGAGLANAAFLRPGAAVVELDAHAHRRSNRHFFGALSAALGLRYQKAWLDAGGARVTVDPAGLRNCTRRRTGDGSIIVGNSDAELRDANVLPYLAPAAISAATLAALLAEVAAAGPVDGE